MHSRAFTVQPRTIELLAMQGRKRAFLDDERRIPRIRRSLGLNMTFRTGDPGLYLLVDRCTSGMALTAASSEAMRPTPRRRRTRLVLLNQPDHGFAGSDGSNLPARRRSSRGTLGIAITEQRPMASVELRRRS